MNLGFTRLDTQRAACPAAMPLDYFRLIAGLGAAQAASPVAAMEAALSDNRLIGVPLEQALVLIFEAGADWVGAADSLKGSFNPGMAAHLGEMGE